MVDNKIKREFPNLKKTHYKITSPETVEYNCIAWAAGEMDCWWWPDSMETKFWPIEVKREDTLESFVKAFETLSYSVCKSPAYENGFEKIAIYSDNNGKPTHAARQLNSGFWTSKLGSSFDIEHGFEGVSDSDAYGEISVIMKRPN